MHNPQVSPVGTDSQRYRDSRKSEETSMHASEHEEYSSNPLFLVETANCCQLPLELRLR
jgi:hypothetical protein